MPPRLLVAMCCITLAGGSAGCGAHRRAQRLEKQLDTVQYRKPLDEVWQQVRMLLAERQYPLAGEDAVAVGQSEPGLASRIFSRAKATRSLGEDQGLLQQLGVVGTAGKPVRGYFLETSWAPQGTPRARMRAEAVEDDRGVTVRLLRITEDFTSHEETVTRAGELELELARRLDPAAAARVEAGAN